MNQFPQKNKIVKEYLSYIWNDVRIYQSLWTWISQKAFQPVNKIPQGSARRIKVGLEGSSFIARIRTEPFGKPLHACMPGNYFKSHVYVNAAIQASVQLFLFCFVFLLIATKSCGRSRLCCIHHTLSRSLSSSWSL